MTFISCACLKARSSAVSLTYLLSQWQEWRFSQIGVTPFSLYLIKIYFPRFFIYHIEFINIYNAWISNYNGKKKVHLFLYIFYFTIFWRTLINLHFPIYFQLCFFLLWLNSLDTFNLLVFVYRHYFTNPLVCIWIGKSYCNIDFSPLIDCLRKKASSY